MLDSIDERKKAEIGSEEAKKPSKTKVKWQKQPFYPMHDFSHSEDPLVQAQKDSK